MILAVHVHTSTWRMSNMGGIKNLVGSIFAANGAYRGSVYQAVFLTTALLVLTWGQINSVNCCPEGWVEWNRSCYMLTKTEMMWRDVHSLCHSLGARMAVPSSNEENKFMSHLAASNSNDSLWIDCTDRDEEGVWVCGEDGLTGMEYRNWYDDQPNNWPGSGDESGADFASLGSSGFWGDWGDRQFHSMCEMKLPRMQCCTITADNKCY